jgi:lipopolysaccharide export system permease protein
MLRLSRYIFGQITGATLNVFLLILFIGWLTQILTQFSIVTVKGQNVLTFLGQTGLLLPTIAAIILPACLANFTPFTAPGASALWPARSPAPRC